MEIIKTSEEKEIWRMTIGQLNRIYELKALLNNCVDDDKAILYERELEGLEEANELIKKEGI